MVNVKDDVELERIDNLIPYGNNPKQHPSEQIDKIASSIKNYGFDQPIVVDGENEIIKGHGRLEAAKKLGLEEVPVITQEDLSKAQAKAARLADNKTAESDWEHETLAVELEELEEMDVDLQDTGFDEEEYQDILDEHEKSENEDQKYTDKIEAPTYEPTREEQPDIEELLNKEKFNQLLEKIENADIPEDRRDFLKLTAYRHIRFDYENIAEFYAHAEPKVQELMEDLALVIIDFDKAIEQGFIQMSEHILKGQKDA